MTDRERQLEIVCQKLLKYFGAYGYVDLPLIVEEDPSTLAVCVSLARAALAVPSAVAGGPVSWAPPQGGDE